MREKKLSRRRWLKEATVLGLAVDGSTHARALRANERQNSPAAGRGDDRALKLKLETRDYFDQALVFRWPEGIGSANVEARVSITQPYWGEAWSARAAGIVHSDRSFWTNGR